MIKQSSILTMRTLPILKWKVKLIRTQENGFGFGIRGGKEYNLPLYVLRLIQDGPAFKSNLIQVGDIIEAINGQSIGW